jgi:hypothetical protein
LHFFIKKFIVSSQVSLRKKNSKISAETVPYKTVSSRLCRDAGLTRGSYLTADVTVMKTKKDKAYSYEHCKERALQRYDVILTPEIYKEWNQLCTYDNRIQMDVSNRQQVHVIKWKDKLITVVKSLSNTTAQEEYIKTVLPEGTKLMFGTDAPNYQKISDWYKAGNHK